MSESADRSRAAEASRWFTVMTRPSVDPEELEAFVAWRRTPANAAAFSKVQRTWEQAGGLADRPWVAAATEAVLAKYPARAAVRFTPRRFVLSPVTLGVAVVLLAVGIGAAVWLVAPTRFATKVGGQRLEVLADGSKVRLNTATRVRVDYGDAERRVVIERGEAFFEVAHDAARPFVVVADGARVRALGTRFDVRRDGPAVRVALVQGRIEVRAGNGETAMLTPGQSVVVDRGGVTPPRSVDVATAAGWTEGRLTFSGVPLREAVAEVNRYSERKIVLQAPPAVLEERISGQFVTGDLDAFVAGARSLYGLQVTRETPREIRLTHD